MKRKGVLIGAYVPPEMKEALKRRSQLQHRTLSQELIRILAEALGQPIPGSPDRRGERAGGAARVEKQFLSVGDFSFKIELSSRCLSGAKLRVEA